MKKSLIFLISFLVVAGPKKDLTKAQNIAATLATIPKFTYDNRVDRWFGVKNLIDQDKIMTKEDYDWDDKQYYPPLWPTMVHAFPKEIDQEAMKFGISRIKKNQKNYGQDAIYVAVPARYYFEHKNAKIYLDGVLEYGFNSESHKLFHRYFRAFSWKNSEENIKLVKNLYVFGEKSKDSGWNRSKISDQKNFPNPNLNSLVTIYKGKNS